MAEGTDDPGEGFRRRSLSESDTERISDLPLTPGISDSRRPRGVLDLPLIHHNSVPNVNSPGNGSFIESPAFRGIGTRLNLQSRINPNINDKQTRVLNESTRIIKEVESWILSTKSTPPPLLNLYLKIMSYTNAEYLE